MTVTISKNLSFTDQRGDVYSCVPWDGKFGCLKISSWAPEGSQSFPYWPVVTINGDPLGPKTLNENQAWFKAQMLYAPYDPIFLEEYEKYLNLIPVKVRHAASHFQDNQWLALDAMRHTHGFSDFLEMEYKGLGMNFVNACWALGQARNLSPAERASLNRKIMFEPRNSFITELTGVACHNTFLKALPRLMPSEACERLIRKLFEASESKKKLQIIGMKSQITERFLDVLLDLPEWLTLPKIVYAVAQYRKCDYSLERIIPPSVLDADGNLQKRLVQSLRHVKSLHELELRLAKWSQRIFKETIFPPPPFAGDETLVPILSGEELRKEGLEMCSCVAGYAEDVAEGNTYFYKWLGTEKATVQFERSKNERWIITEHLGYQNAELAFDTIIDIYGASAWLMQETQGSLFLFETSVAGTRYYDSQIAINSLACGNRLELRREPNNKYDSDAVEIFTSHGLKLGYIPRNKNHRVALCMDRGMHVMGQVTAITRDNYNDISLGIHLVNDGRVTGASH